MGILTITFIFIKLYLLGSVHSSLKTKLSYSVERVKGSGQRLAGFYLYSEEVFDPHECAILCYHDDSCVSYNVYQSTISTYTCEMNNERGDFFMTLVPTEGCQHFVVNKPESSGFYASAIDAEKEYWYLMIVQNGFDYCFLFSNDSFGGTTNWKAFYTMDSNITATLTLPRNGAPVATTKLVWYLGDGTMQLAYLDTSYGGNNKSEMYSDNTGASWDLQPIQSIADVHGPLSPPIVDAALTFDNITYLFYNDKVYEVEQYNPLGNVIAVYYIWSDIPRNLFLGAPKGMTAASEDFYPFARIYRGYRWIYYNLLSRKVNPLTYGVVVP